MQLPIACKISTFYILGLSFFIYFLGLSFLSPLTALAPILDRQFPKSVYAELPNSPPLVIMLTPSTDK
jgi:hypothetical protein